MAENTQDVQATAANEAPAPDAATNSAAAPEGEKQSFVPFFNPEYQFRLGAPGDMSSAYRLGAIFLFMLVAAAMMYFGAVWWADRHKRDAAAEPAPVVVTDTVQERR